MDISTISYNGTDYPTRSITIFEGTEKEVTINVSTEQLSAELAKNGYKDTEVDDCFACYVPFHKLFSLNDRDFAEYIEINYYN
jgi:hypothetical protein